MSNLRTFFDFSLSQLRVLVMMSAVALIMSGYLLIKTWSTPAVEPVKLPVFLASPDQQLTGLFVLDPNTSPADSLELLPGIGKVIADRIVAYRVDHHFEKEVDITEVNGIGPKTYEQLRPYLKVKRR